MFRVAVLRRVFLDHETAELLRKHRKAQLRLRLAAGEAWQDNDLVFCQDDGRPWNPDHVSKRFKKLAALAGVPVISLHEGGRHTGNSLMQDAGVDQKLRMREVGHADKFGQRPLHPSAGAGPSGRRRADGGSSADDDESSVIRTSVSILVPSVTGAAKSQPAGNRSTAGQTWWGGWGSNPRPADYESAALTC